MVNVLIRHKIENYEVWKAAFDDYAQTRKARGEKSYQIFRPLDNPNNLVILQSWENESAAQAFLESAELKNKMQEAGVLEAPEIYIMNKVDQGKFE